MPGLTEPFTTNYTSIRLRAGNGDETVNQGDSDNVFFGHPNPGPTDIIVECLAMVGGKLTKTGYASIRVSANTLNVYIGSGEGSSQADAFAKMVTVSGVFPIIQAQ